MAIPTAVTHITGQISLASIAPQALRVAGKPLEKASDYSARRMNEVRSGFMHGKTEQHHLRDQARSDAERGQAARTRLNQFIRDT
jgi:type IV secretion system protein VirB6